ncbi:PIN domain-containing protein [Nocardia blacklockiae]|uniref:PIN domain-containing protein n=1 Tax=Nocardia blacklockiae TaxID=480036 RepID=UPI001895C00E|nr:PIN domain-containing protein [Nocardia blacklockiae]MBF6171301.1 DUF4935 domain-containing protein [Nocardia blacklockiae]
MSINTKPLDADSPDSPARLLIDTSTWLDLAKRRDGHRWIGALYDLIQDGLIQLLVPDLIIEEFERNRSGVESTITRQMAERFKLIRRDINEYGNEEQRRALDEVAYHVPLISAMATRNFDDILTLLRNGTRLEATADEHYQVVQRGLDKRAPFHHKPGSVADALLIELYASCLREDEASSDTVVAAHAFVTSNSDDFSNPNGDKREPHSDLSDLFARDGSLYGLGVDGLQAILYDIIGEEILNDILSNYGFSEDPRTLSEVLEAEKEYFDRVWYHRSLMHDYRLEQQGASDELRKHQEIAASARKRIEDERGGADALWPNSDFELGMLNGKLSALRWVLGDEWDFLDT